MSAPTPITTPTIEERLRDTSLVAMYDGTMQGADSLMSKLMKREKASQGSAEKEYWRARWRRVLEEKRAVPSDDAVAILVQQDIWVAEIRELRAAEEQAAAAVSA